MRAGLSSAARGAGPEGGDEVSCTVWIVEDDAPTRARLARAVEGDERLVLLGAVGTARESIEGLREAPDVVLVDLGLPDGSGLDVIRAARQLSADIQTLVVTVFGDEKSVVEAIEAGARGYLLKDGNEAEIARAIIELQAGGCPISAQIARFLLHRFQEAPTPAAAAPSLSEREREILDLVVRGFTFAEIAGFLEISAHTVNTYVRRVYRKLEVRSRSEAVYEALQLGLVKVQEDPKEG
ncbi:MAG: response regulator transcription factor [Myxococcales bacterium]|nr:response regulator transcription factor [Myxococcales bacterium]